VVNLNLGGTDEFRTKFPLDGPRSFQIRPAVRPLQSDHTTLSLQRSGQLVIKTHDPDSLDCRFVRSFSFLTQTSTCLLRTLHNHQQEASEVLTSVADSRPGCCLCHSLWKTICGSHRVIIPPQLDFHIRQQHSLLDPYLHSTSVSIRVFTTRCKGSMLKGDAVAGEHALCADFHTGNFATCSTSLIVSQSSAANTALASGVFSVSQTTHIIPTLKDSGEQVAETVVEAAVRFELLPASLMNSSPSRIQETVVSQSVSKLSGHNLDHLFSHGIIFASR